MAGKAHSGSLKDPFFIGALIEKPFSWELDVSYQLGPFADFTFHPEAALRSFPLAEVNAVDVLRTPYFIKEHTTDFLEKEIFLRSGVSVEKTPQHWGSDLCPAVICKILLSRSVFLCGDAGARDEIPIADRI